MGWNGAETKRPVRVYDFSGKNARTTFRSSRRGVIVGVLSTILVLAIAIILLSPSNHEKQTDQQDSIPVRTNRLVNVVQPKTPVSHKVVPKPLAAPKDLYAGAHTNARGNLVSVDGKILRAYPLQDRPKAKVVKINSRNRSIEERAFKTTSDRQLAYLANWEPGEPFGDGLDTSKFTENFKKSLNESVEILPEDTPEVVELKKAVIELRQELKDQLDAGKDIKQIVDDAILEMQKQGNYREELQKEVDRISKDPSLSEADTKDLIDAANAMLKDKGLKSIEFTGLMKQRLRIRKFKNERNKGK